MTRIQILSSVLIAGSVLAGSAMPAAASVFEDAKKVCLERFNDEQKSGSVPKGMNKSRYLAQCQKSYVHSVQLENELNHDTWLTTPLAGTLVNETDGVNLWRRLLVSISPDLRLLANEPDDPALN